MRSCRTRTASVQTSWRKHPPPLTNEVNMLIWSALAAALLSGLTLGLLSNGAPEWATQTVELVTVVAVFVLVCLAETTGSRPDKPSSR